MGLKSSRISKLKYWKVDLWIDGTLNDNFLASYNDVKLRNQQWSGKELGAGLHLISAAEAGGIVWDHLIFYAIFS